MKEVLRVILKELLMRVIMRGLLMRGLVVRKILVQITREVTRLRLDRVKLPEHR